MGQWKVISREKNSSMYPKDVTYLDFFYTDVFFHFLLSKAYAVLWAAGNRCVGAETPAKHNDFDQFWKFKFHFRHFPRNTRFLSFDGLTNYLYLFKNHRQKFLWPRERPSSNLKVTKRRFGLNIQYLSEPVFADFCCREGISCSILIFVTWIKSFSW